VVRAVQGYLAGAAGGGEPDRNAFRQAEQELAGAGREPDRDAAVRSRQRQVEIRDKPGQPGPL